MITRCLAIETSCDDTSAAIVDHTGKVLGLASVNQDLAHAPYGGIVPEIAGRNHSLQLLPVIEALFKKTRMSWDQVGGIAVTNRPGLVGSLIVGVVTAKSLSQATGIPLIGVNHLEGHILAPFLHDTEYHSQFPHTEKFIALAVSGGHTSIYRVSGLGQYKILGATLDDAAGEAFDKFGKMVGLGFPGGVAVDKHSQTGDFAYYDFPRSMIKEDNYFMSFSGLKSSAQRLVRSLPPEEIQERLPDLCASFQEAVVDILMAKLHRAVTKTGIKNVVITGGVSANSRLRFVAQDWAKENKLKLQIPPAKYCTDNAAMIGFAGILRLNRGERSDLTLGPSPISEPEDFIGV